MSRTVAMLALVGTILCASSGASAQDVPPSEAIRVDDTGTVVLDPVLELEWHPEAAGAASSIVAASTKVSVHLNLAPWVGRSGRIYMTLPRNAGPTVRASWQTGGTLLPGTLISGDRALVYSGPVNGPILRDLIEITLEVDGMRLFRTEALAFGFEIEVDR